MSWFQTFETVFVLSQIFEAWSIFQFKHLPCLTRYGWNRIFTLVVSLTFGFKGFPLLISKILCNVYNCDSLITCDFTAIIYLIIIIRNNNCPAGMVLVLNQKWKHQNNVLNLFKVNKNTITDFVLVSSLLHLSRFYTLFRCFHCWIWTSKCRLGKCCPDFELLFPILRLIVVPWRYNTLLEFYPKWFELTLS